jgi:hypothetical protein
VKEIIAKYPGFHARRRCLTTYHPRAFPEVWRHMPPLLLETDGHHAAFKDGHIHDWTANRFFMIRQAYRVVLRG